MRESLRSIRRTYLLWRYHRRFAALAFHHEAARFVWEQEHEWAKAQQREWISNART